MRLPNGYGGVKKLSGKRSKPFAAVITTKYESKKSRKDISFLKKPLGAKLYSEVFEKYKSYCKDAVKRQTQKAIGYYKTREEALNALAQYNQNPYDISNRDMTFGQIYDILYSTHFSKMKSNAMNSYTTSYRKCDSIIDMRVRELKKPQLQQIVDLQSDKSKSTQRNLLKLFHAVYKYAIENDICEKDYSKFVSITSDKAGSKRTPFSRKEIETLWANLNRYEMADSVLIMIYSGIRVGELLDLKKDDIHLGKRYINLRGTKTCASERVVPIHKKLIPLFKKRLNSTGEMFISKSVDSADKMPYMRYRTAFFDVMMLDMQMEHTPHECRHTFATFATISEFNPVLLKKMLGHTARDITQDIYTHVFIEDLVAEIDKYHI